MLRIQSPYFFKGKDGQKMLSWNLIVKGSSENLVDEIKFIV